MNCQAAARVRLHEVVIGVQPEFIAEVVFDDPSGADLFISNTKGPNMSRMSVFALAAALALGSVSLATEASARGAGGHAGGHGMGMGVAHMSGAAHMSGSGGHWSGGPHWGGGINHHHFFLRRGFGVGIYGPYFGPDYYPDSSSYDDDSCWQLRHVPTRRGWRWRNVNVCAVPY
jgi:hypothetical protein